MYDAHKVSRYYDDYGEREWARLEATPADRVSFRIHRWHLQRFIQPRNRVLEIGAGPGRFTIELAKLQAQITVGDLSPGQLALNRSYVQEAGYEHAVTDRTAIDVVDLSEFPDAFFDAVVCFGGPVSYVFDRADDAVAEMLRVTKVGGFVLLSVMSLLGATRRFLPGVLSGIGQVGLDAVQHVIDTGDLQGLGGPHECRDLSALLSRHPCAVVAASAANFLSAQHEEAAAEFLNGDATREAFLQWEVEFCREPGALDGGTHIIAVVQRVAVLAE